MQILRCICSKTLTKYFLNNFTQKTYTPLYLLENTIHCEAKTGFAEIMQIIPMTEETTAHIAG